MKDTKNNEQFLKFFVRNKNYNIEENTEIIKKMNRQLFKAQTNNIKNV